jgi:hypothetical protein
MLLKGDASLLRLTAIEQEGAEVSGLIGLSHGIQR